MTVSQVLQLLYKASSVVDVRVITAVPMNFNLLVPRSMIACDIVISPVNIPLSLGHTWSQSLEVNHCTGSPAWLGLSLVPRSQLAPRRT